MIEHASEQGKSCIGKEFSILGTDVSYAVPVV